MQPHPVWPSVEMADVLSTSHDDDENTSSRLDSLVLGHSPKQLPADSPGCIHGWCVSAAEGSMDPSRHAAGRTKKGVYYWVIMMYGELDAHHIINLGGEFEMI